MRSLKNSTLMIRAKIADSPEQLPENLRSLPLRKTYGQQGALACFAASCGECARYRIPAITLFVVLFFLSLTACAPKEIQISEPIPAPRPVKVAVVLGAGAAKGFAHIGVLKVLEANHIPVHMVVGTSVGSFIGSLYAYGLNAYQLQQLAFGIEKGDVVDLALPDNGFVKGERLERFVNRVLRNTPIEKLKTPFFAVATDLQKGEEVVFGSGNAGAAVRASCSVPGVFQPARIANRLYVDGGVVSPVAVNAALKQGADFVIAVDISAPMEDAPPAGTIDTILQSIDIMYAIIAGVQISKADMVIRPNTKGIASGDFSKKHEAILEGERAATTALPELLTKIGRLRAEGRLP